MATKTTLLTNDEYRAQQGFSKSDLDLIHDSPALFEWNKNHPAPGSPSVDTGTFLHSLVLEPEEFAKEYTKAPKFDLRTKAGKEQKAAFEQVIKASGKTVITSDQWEMIHNMESSVKAHPVAAQLLYSEGESEVSIFAELQNMKVKCRPDRIATINGKHYLVDLKKTADIDTFAKSVINFRYHVQDAFYSDVYKQLTGEAPRFVFVVVGEKQSIGRHPVRVFELPQEVKDLGRSQYLEDLEKAKTYADFGCGLDIESLNIPNYLLK